MKRQRISDAEIKAALRYGYPSFDPMLTDLLRCRRALRRIARLPEVMLRDGRTPAWALARIRFETSQALGKGATR